MENYQNNRLVRKFFKCTKCKEYEGKLVNPFANNIYCTKCSSLLSEISESHYKKIKKQIHQKEDIKEVPHQMPYRPNEDLLKNSSHKYNYDRPSSKHTHKNKKTKNDDKHKYHKNKKTNRHQSSTHYSDINFNNINNYNNNYNNYNRNSNNNNQYNNNNINIINFDNNNNQNRQEHREHHRHGARRREHSMDQNNTHSNNFFSNFFRGLGFQPFVNFEFSIETPFINNNNPHNHNPFRITVQRQNVSNDIFDPIFFTFGSLFNGAFQDNYSSNFSSNYRGNFFDEIIRILERNQAESRKKAHPPTSEESLKKLKKFSMNEKYCKKDKKGKVEFPNCCICLNEIERGEKTVLLPCGHMFHWKCCLTWLKSNNTCPMCRFEIK